ncbi:MAG: hypothetical protein D3924_16990 [Candidatus Electrothrix sp. AR4]|nr:hypothetical protein [Candidatus Electrothrix sp. AR4]
MERYEGNLDDHFTKDNGASLLKKLSYSNKDQLNNRAANHKIPIDGNVHDGTATLKSAINLYFKFKTGERLGRTSSQRTPVSIIKRKKKVDWPVWNHPSDEELYELIKLTAKYIKFLHPDIIREVVNDNNQHRARWSEQLEKRNISSAIYLWENSPCAFPGIRRYAGSKEIAYFKKHTKLSSSEIKHAVKLDDNDYPKQIWSYVFRENKFQKYGPENFALAHLADHKEFNNRIFSEFNIKNLTDQHQLFGLFTCPTNTAYIPTSLLRPTDFSPTIRQLLVIKSQDLYGDFCNILPPWINLNPEVNIPWDQTHFQWSDPVGTAENIKLFLEFRNETMESILEQ